VQFSHEQLKHMLLTMHRIRAFEEKVDEFFARAMIHGTTHLYTGEEAVATGACMNLQKGDLFTSTHRGHGHCIAGGADLNLMMAELLGKRDGYCKGKGGSMHIADVEAGNLGANGVVGGGIPLAVGAALTLQLKKTDRVCLCFFGDGASNQGCFHESANLAAIWNLPVVFICENNMYGMSFSVKKSVKAESIAARGAAYGMPGHVVDGNDVFAVADAVEEAVARARAGRGPTLIECRTYRWKGHSKSDGNVYRTRDEIESWKRQCPIQRLRERMISERIVTSSEANAIETRAKAEIESAVEFARSSPEPSLDELTTDVFA
jgi:acetoin:2,6-dichlorophenolindophenol oxidoreductase subunit alpha